MARKLTSDIVDLLNRAEEESMPKGAPIQQSWRPTAQPSMRPAPQQRRDVYSGDPQAKTPGYAARPANKKVVQKKRRSTFNVVAVLFFSAICIIAYISNILAVNALVVGVHQLQAQHDKVVSSNNVLRAEINRKSAWERISRAAKEQGLSYAKERPQALDVDENKLDEFKDK